MKILWVLAALGVVMTAGCTKKTDALRQQAVRKEVTTALAVRLEAAMQISGNEQRDAALQKVANDAAGARDAATVKKALDMIAGSENKDRTAEACALQLVRQNDPKSAGEIAQLISGTEARDRTLAAIAKGDK